MNVPIVHAQNFDRVARPSDFCEASRSDKTIWASRASHSSEELVLRCLRFSRMKNIPASWAPVLGLIAALAACSSGPDESNSGTSNVVAESPTPSASGSANTIQDEAREEGNVVAPSPASARVIGLEGLGDLRVGEPVPGKGAWAERGAQTSDACRTVSSPEYPGVYAIVSEGKVRRITVGQRSDVKLAEGVGIGATETEVGKWFAGFRKEPHKYEDAPAKYLTAPNAEKAPSALRFEIGQDGKVKLIHVGTMPVLAYVEGCS